MLRAPLSQYTGHEVGVLGGGARQRRKSARRDRCCWTCVRASRGLLCGGGLHGSLPPPIRHERGVYAAVAEWRSLAGLASIHGPTAAGSLLTRVCRFETLAPQGAPSTAFVRMVVDWRLCRMLVHLAVVTPQPCLSAGCRGGLLTAPNSASLQSTRIAARAQNRDQPAPDPSRTSPSRQNN